MADIVIGSGPSGVAAAMALLARGRQVTMLDGGKELEPAGVAAREAIAATDPAGWTAADREAWMAPQRATPPGQVRRCGSDFAMEPGAATYADAGVALRASRAAGGLSNLWGSAVLPYTASDLAGWPISIDDLAPHYRAVAEFIPAAGEADALAPMFPALPMAGRARISGGAQAEDLLKRLRAARLAPLGIHAGAARVAVEPGCKGCGMCLQGCPWGYIYSAQATLAGLRGHPGFTYRPGALVSQVQDRGDGAVAVLEGGAELAADAVFLGAGVLETARILLRSGAAGPEMVMLDSQHAFLPMLQRRAAGPGRYHTLPQAFVELDAPDVSKRLVHAQLYSWNEFYLPDLMASYGHLPLAGPVMRALSARLVVAQLFLHSDHSARVALRLAPDGRLLCRVMPQGDTAAVMARAAGLMARGMARAGLYALKFALRLGEVGSSYHVGGTVPMALRPGAGQADVLGRPAGMARVHVVDASVLPSVPATTITFGVMANAHRIGSLAP